MMIGRELIGKTYPPFSAELSEDLCREMADLMHTSPPVARPTPVPPVNWPAIVSAHGTACLMCVWEDLGVDPLRLWLVREEFEHVRQASCGETLVGNLTIEDVTEHFEPDKGMFQQIHLQIRFADNAGTDVAGYRCVYAFPLAKSTTGRKPTETYLGR